MFALICAYLCIPTRFRFIGKLLAMLFVIIVFVMVVTLFFRVMQTVPNNHKRAVHAARVSVRDGHLQHQQFVVVGQARRSDEDR